GGGTGASGVSVRGTGGAGGGETGSEPASAVRHDVRCDGGGGGAERRGVGGAGGGVRLPDREVRSGAECEGGGGGAYWVDRILHAGVWGGDDRTDGAALHGVIAGFVAGSA